MGSIIPWASLISIKFQAHELEKFLNFNTLRYKSICFSIYLHIWLKKIWNHGILLFTFSFGMMKNNFDTSYEAQKRCIFFSSVAFASACIDFIIVHFNIQYFFSKTILIWQKYHFRFLFYQFSFIIPCEICMKKTVIKHKRLWIHLDNSNQLIILK